MMPLGEQIWGDSCYIMLQCVVIFKPKSKRQQNLEPIIFQPSMHGPVLIEALMQWHWESDLGFPNPLAFMGFTSPWVALCFDILNLTTPNELEWFHCFLFVRYLRSIFTCFQPAAGFSSQGDLSLLLCFDDETVIFRRWEKSWHSKPHVDKMVIRRMDGLVEQVAVFRIWV